MTSKNLLGGALFLGCLLVVMKISGSFTLFLDMPSALLVILGTVGLTILESHPHRSCGELCLSASKVAWKVGLVGVVLGMVALLANLSEPSQIGPNVAMALLSLLYGLTAHLLLKSTGTALQEAGKTRPE